MTIVVRATQADNKDRYTLTTLTIARGSSPPLAAGSVQQVVQSRVAHSSNSGARGILSPPEQNQVQQKQQQSFGLEFEPDKLNIDVSESVAINEKIARVRARYLGNSEPTTTLAQVDLVTSASTSLLQSTQRASDNRTRRTSSAAIQQQQQQQLTSTKRPINYQILDDQTDQFGINGLGEIFVKRALDYEQKQQYKFRVLATYTKYSDICQVQVNVLNVNDNKPKVSS